MAVTTATILQTPNIEVPLYIIPEQGIFNRIFSRLIPRDLVHFSRASRTCHRFFEGFNLSDRIEKILAFAMDTKLVTIVAKVKYGDYETYEAIQKEASKNLLEIDSSTESERIFFRLFNLLSYESTEVEVIKNARPNDASWITDVTYSHLNELVSEVYEIGLRYKRGRVRGQNIASFTASYLNDHYWSNFSEDQRDFELIPNSVLENALWELFTQRFGQQGFPLEAFEPLVKQIIRLEIGRPYRPYFHAAPFLENLHVMEEMITYTFQYVKPLYKIVYQSHLAVEKEKRKSELFEMREAWRIINRDLPLLGKAAIAMNAVAIADLLFNALTPGNLTDVYQAPAYYTCISIFGFGAYRAINYLREKIPNQFINRDLRPAGLITSCALALPMAVLTGRILTNLGAESGLLIYPSQGIIGTAWAIVQLRVFSNWMFY